LFYFCSHRILYLKGEEGFMKYYFSFFILLIIINLAAKAQQEPIYSTYMLTRHVANPGFVGSESTVNAMFLNRTMFAGIGDGKPVTSVFGVEAPIDILGAKNGLGLIIVSDRLGFYDNVEIDAKYAYHHQLTNGMFGGGISFRISNFTLNPTWNSPSEGDYWIEATSDPTVPIGSDLSTITFGVGLGFYYETTDYYLGLAATNLNRSEHLFRSNSNEEWNSSYNVPHYYLNGAYNIELPDPLFDLQPSFILRSDLASYTLDVNGTTYFKDKYWAGFGLRVSPRNFQAFNFLGGVELFNGLKISYMLDINTSIITLAPTSHEIMVSYSFNIETKRDQRYKSIRYL
jgi:type IX secretion system PorP/SprF family membrane protein